MFFAKGVTLIVENGMLAYNNVNKKSWKMDANAKLCMGAGTSLYLYQPLDLLSGAVVLDEKVVLGQTPQAKITGSVIPLGIYFPVKL